MSIIWKLIHRVWWFDDNGSGGLGAGVGELNLCGGTLVWHQYEPGVYPATTDPGKTFEEYIADGKIFAHDKAGRVVVDGDYDLR